jgi:hypothetical protein
MESEAMISIVPFKKRPWLVVAFWANLFFLSALNLTWEQELTLN